MEATVSPRATGRGLIRRKADYIPPSRYTLRAAASDGDALTRLSFLILGAGNLARRQIVKGVFFLAVEVAYIAYMVVQGVGSLVTLGTLGYRTQTKHKVDGYWYYDAGDNSVLLLTAGVATVFITVLFAVFWSYAVRSAYKAQVLQRETGAAPTLLDDWHNLTDRNAQVSMMFLPVVGILVFTVLPTLIMVCIAFTSYDSDHVVLFDWVGVWRSIFSLSMAVPQFVSLLAINQMLQPEGAINSMLESWGWITDPLPFFTDPTWARVTVIVVNLWIGIPFTIMQITGILQNIPADQYEAARIDGANWWQTFTRITMPYLVFVLTPYLITTFTGNVNNFNVIYLLSGGNPTAVGDTAGSTDLLITWLYKLTVDRGDYNLGGVIGIFTFVVLAIVSLITYRSSGSYKNEGGFR